MTTEIRTMMVPLDGDHPSDAQLQKVGALATHLGARVIAVSASEHTPSFYFAAGAVAGDVLEQDEQRMKERMAAAANRCRMVLTDLHVAIACRSAIDIPIDVFAREARSADLIVCFARRAPATYTDADPGEIVLKAGRPVLVVPSEAAWRMPERILITWKDSREARRAVRDALPFLQRAKEVAVVEFMEEEESPKAVDARLRDVLDWLKAHGITASKQVIAPKGGITDAIEAEARSFKADWIVAGAYGHSRLGEWIFGGVTRHLLRHSSLPAFLSH